MRFWPNAVAGIWCCTGFDIFLSFLAFLYGFVENTFLQCFQPDKKILNMQFLQKWLLGLKNLTIIQRGTGIFQRSFDRFSFYQFSSMRLYLIELTTLKTFFLLASAFCCNISNQIKFLLVGFYEKEHIWEKSETCLVCGFLERRNRTDGQMML